MILFSYQLHPTKYGWVNVAENNIWDWFFYAYYIGYTATGLLLLWRWGKKAADPNIKKQSRTIFLAIIAALILASFTDVLLSSMFSILPQMAPAITLVPILAIYHALKKDSFKIDELHRSSSYVNIVAGVTLYVIISFYQALLLPEAKSRAPFTWKSLRLEGAPANTDANFNLAGLKGKQAGIWLSLNECRQFNSCLCEHNSKH